MITRAVATVGGVSVAVSLLGGSVTAAGASPNHGVTGIAAVAKTLSGIEALPRYRQSDWGYAVLDQDSGKVLLAQNQQKMFDPGSTMKIYSVSTGLRLYGPSYRFRTPVYRQGSVAAGTLNGNLVWSHLAISASGSESSATARSTTRTCPRSTIATPISSPERSSRRATPLAP